jgi:hypothetical protein
VLFRNVSFVGFGRDASRGTRATARGGTNFPSGQPLHHLPARTFLSPMFNLPTKQHQQTAAAPVPAPTINVFSLLITFCFATSSSSSSHL